MPYSVEEIKHPTRDELVHKEVVIMDNTGTIGADLDVRVSLSTCLLYTSPSPRDRQKSRMPSSA